MKKGGSHMKLRKTVNNVYVISALILVLLIGANLFFKNKETSQSVNLNFKNQTSNNLTNLTLYYDNEKLLLSNILKNGVYTVKLNFPNDYVGDMVISYLDKNNNISKCELLKGEKMKGNDINVVFKDNSDDGGYAITAAFGD